MSQNTRKKCQPTVLCILDGWGIYKDYNGNAITKAATPNFDMLWNKYPHTQLNASSKYVGLPPGQDGNSEAGHLNLGAGRVVEQDSVTISKAISTGTFFKNPAFMSVVAHTKKHKSKVHLMGLLTGWQSAHADPDHVLAILTMLHQEGVHDIYLHLFTDGRDSFQYGAVKFLNKIKKEMVNGERIATISGRYYAMDRKKKWGRSKKTYEALTEGKADFYARSAEEAIEQAYERGETDEFIIPTVIVDNGICDDKGICHKGTPVTTIDDNDAIIYFNLRSDRARQLTKTFVQKNFNAKNPGSFERKKVAKNISFVAMTDFGPDLDSILSAFPSQDVKSTLPLVLKDCRQLYISETEKYAHVTYFFNGGYADPIGGEDRLMIPSPDVPSYDQKPEMSAKKVTDTIVDAIDETKYDFILVNYPNPDMVGHTGNLTAGIKACQAVDVSLGRLYKKIKEKKGILIVTADHGNIEEMIDTQTGEVDTQHSSYPVPFILCDYRTSSIPAKLKKDGALGNVAPTILDLVGIEKPKEMTSKSLIIK